MALVIGLVFIALLTMLGLTAMSVSSLEERMSGNTRDRTLAFNAAEASLRDCQTILDAAALPDTDPGFAALPDFDGVAGFNNPTVPGMYQVAALGAAPVYEVVNWASNDQVRFNATTPAGSSQAPRCVIEELPPLPGASGGSMKAGTALEPNSYRVTALGFGRNDATEVTLQSTYLFP
jgi:type IV pilus assembly protein PilX